MTDTGTQGGRLPLTRPRVLGQAVQLADHGGLPAVTMRRVATALGVEAMSLYNHVPSKDALLAGMAEAVTAEINVAVRDLTVADPERWPGLVRVTVLAAREVVLGHPWASEVIGSVGAMSEESMRYFDTLAGRMRQAGLSVELVHHAMHALGSRAMGFSTELFSEASVDGAPLDEVTVAAMADRYPAVAEVAALAASHDPASTIGWCDDQSEFEFGLDLLLDGLGRAAQATDP